MLIIFPSFFLTFFFLLYQQLSNILKDPEASKNDRFVAMELLKNANIAANMVLPGCQDTGTAICMGNFSFICLLELTLNQSH